MVQRRQFLKSVGALSGYFIVSAILPFHGCQREHKHSNRSFSFPQGVASGDPTENSIILWTRIVEKPSLDKSGTPLELLNSIATIVQVSTQKDFKNVIVEKEVQANAEDDFTIKILVKDLKPNTTYYYRFLVGKDISEPLGRTFTAPKSTDKTPFNFAFVSCQHIQLGYMTPYRRMIHEDQQKPEDEQIKFILHLGDFIYEEYWHPEERKEGAFLRRKLKDNIRLPDGGKSGTLRYPVSLADYRHLYKLYISDPDLKAARARWPFICVWDDHEFSNNSWQSTEFYDEELPAQKRKMAANQAWFEYIPAMLVKDFTYEKVENKSIEVFDESFLGLEENNIKAIDSLFIYRSFRWGKLADFVLTDNRSFRAAPVPSDEFGAQVKNRAAFWFTPEEVIPVLDGGKHYNNGNPPDYISFDNKPIPNYRKNKPTGTVLGSKQKLWFKETMKQSEAVWKLWGNSFGTISRRADFQNLPDKWKQHWKSKSYGVYGTDDWIAFPSERKELLNFFSDNNINNLISLSGDRHNFTCGKLLVNENDQNEKPKGIEFGVSSITTPTSFESREYVSSRWDTLRELYVYKGNQPMLNMLHHYGVASCLEFLKTQNIDKTLLKKNEELGHYLKFIDTSSHGYAIAKVTEETFMVEYNAFDRPITDDKSLDGPTIIYQVEFTVNSAINKEVPGIKINKTKGKLPIPYTNLKV